MFAKLFFNLLLAGCVAVFVFPLSGCGGGDTAPKGPELGELKRYLDEHPELMETADEEMDETEDDEFAAAEALDAVEAAGPQ